LGTALKYFFMCQEESAAGRYDWVVDGPICTAAYSQVIVDAIVTKAKAAGAAGPKTGRPSSKSKRKTPASAQDTDCTVPGHYGHKASECRNPAGKSKRQRNDPPGQSASTPSPRPATTPAAAAPA
jgi:hypothetical protein